MKVKVPKEIKIGTYKGFVKFREHIKVDDGYRGAYNQRTGELYIDPILLMLRDRTLLHEVVHMISFNYECSWNEDDISRMANGLAEFLVQLGIEFDWSEIEGE